MSSFCDRDLLSIGAQAPLRDLGGEYPCARMASARPGPSRQLPRGRHTLDAETVAAQQRARLHEAAIELLAERGYSATTVQDLTTAAGISTITFYDLFSGKSELVLDAFDALVASACATLRDRPVAEGELRVRLAAVLTAVVEAILAQPAGARMALVEVAAVGQPGLDAPPRAGQRAARAAARRGHRRRSAGHV